VVCVCGVCVCVVCVWFGVCVCGVCVVCVCGVCVWCVCVCVVCVCVLCVCCLCVCVWCMCVCGVCVCVCVCVCGRGGKRLIFIGTHKNKRYTYIVRNTVLLHTVFIYYLFFPHVSSLVLGYLQEPCDFFRFVQLIQNPRVT